MLTFIYFHFVCKGNREKKRGDGRQTEVGGGLERKGDLLSTGSLLKCLQPLGLG